MPYAGDEIIAIDNVQFMKLSFYTTYRELKRIYNKTLEIVDKFNSEDNVQDLIRLLSEESNILGKIIDPSYDMYEIKRTLKRFEKYLTEILPRNTIFLMLDELEYYIKNVIKSFNNDKNNNFTLYGALTNFNWFENTSKSAREMILFFKGVRNIHVHNGGLIDNDFLKYNYNVGKKANLLALDKTQLLNTHFKLTINHFELFCKDLMKFLNQMKQMRYVTLN